MRMALSLGLRGMGRNVDKSYLKEWILENEIVSTTENVTQGT